MENFDFRSILRDALKPQGWTYIKYAPPHAELCPVCKGKGVVLDTELEVMKCNGCKGQGWIQIG